MKFPLPRVLLLLTGLSAPLHAVPQAWTARPAARIAPGSLAAKLGEDLLVTGPDSLPLQRVCIKASLPLDSLRKLLTTALKPQGSVQDSPCVPRWRDLGPDLRTAFLSGHPTLRKDWTKRSFLPAQDTTAHIASALQALVHKDLRSDTAIRTLYDSLGIKTAVLTLTRRHDWAGDDQSLVRIVAIDASALFGAPTTLLSLQRIDTWRPPVQGFFARLWRRIVWFFRPRMDTSTAKLVSASDLESILASLRRAGSRPETTLQVSDWFQPLPTSATTPVFSSLPDSLPALASVQFAMPHVKTGEGSTDGLWPRSMLLLPDGKILLAGNTSLYERGVARMAWALQRCSSTGSGFDCRTLAIWDKELHSLRMDRQPEGSVAITLAESREQAPRTFLLRPSDTLLREAGTDIPPQPRTTWKTFYADAISKIRPDLAGIEATFPLPPGTSEGIHPEPLELPGTHEVVISFSSAMRDSAGTLIPRAAAPLLSTEGDSTWHSGIHLMDLRTGKIRYSRLILKGGQYSCLARSPGGRWLAALGEVTVGKISTPQVVLIESRTGIPRYRLPVHAREHPESLGFSWNGKDVFLLNGDFETHLERWRMPDSLADPASRGTFPDQSQEVFDEGKYWLEAPKDGLFRF